MPSPAPSVDATVLGWVSADDVDRAGPLPTADDIASEPALVEHWPRRSARRPAVLVPIISLAVIAALYAGTMLLWPLHAVHPTVEAAEVTSVPAPEAVLPWPEAGTAGVSVAGMGAPVVAGEDAVPTASIAKVVAVMVVLDALPLSPGEQGPSFSFFRQTKWDYLSQNESALAVPVGGSLTEYELLAGTLIGSAGNYIDRLVSSIYPNDAVYARAAMQWLADNRIEGITIVDPSGISPQNTATPAGLLALAERAMADPVVADIVGRTSIELPGAGLVENTNALLGTLGVVGTKTGLINGAYNVLLTADLPVGETTVRVYADVLGQPDPETRWQSARELLTAVQEQLRPTVTVPAGTPVGTVETVWGESVDVLADEDLAVTLFDGADARVSTDLRLGDSWDAGSSAGTVTATGPLDEDTAPAALAQELPGPSPWWRLTHPLDLLGLND